MPKSDEIRLRHMLDAARQAREFAKGKTQADLPPGIDELERVLDQEFGEP